MGKSNIRYELKTCVKELLVEVHHMTCKAKRELCRGVLFGEYLPFNELAWNPQEKTLLTLTSKQCHTCLQTQGITLKRTAPNSHESCSHILKKPTLHTTQQISTWRSPKHIRRACIPTIRLFKASRETRVNPSGAYPQHRLVGV